MKIKLSRPLLGLVLAAAVLVPSALALVQMKNNDTGGACFNVLSGVINYSDAICITSTGDLKVGNGTPNAAAMNGEDMYVEGDLEVDGTVTFTGSLNNGTAGVTLDDGVTDTPALTFQDGTNETAIFVKTDTAFLGLTTTAGDGLNVLTGNLKVGNGTPGVTQDGEDFYVEGTTELVGAVTLDDGSGASPSMTFTDATDETAVLSKVDAGNLTVTTGAGDGLGVLVGNLFVGNGTPGETINGEDLYVEGISEFDGTANFDGAVDFDGTITVGATAVNTAALTAQGRGYFEICGDATTVNNNTVYYGPSQAVVDSATVGQVTCNTDAAGNATEATADAPALTATAIYPLGMVCYTTDQGATVTYTLRSAEAAITPAIAISIADNELSGAASATATTAIASGATVAVAVASTADMAATSFICRVSYAF